MKREYWDVWGIEVLPREEVIAKCGTRAEDDSNYVMKSTLKVKEQDEDNEGG